MPMISRERDGSLLEQNAFCLHDETALRRIPAHADVAQLVERRLAKAKVAGSNPVIRSKSPIV